VTTTTDFFLFRNIVNDDFPGKIGIQGFASGSVSLVRGDDDFIFF